MREKHRKVIEERMPNTRFPNPDERQLQDKQAHKLIEYWRGLPEGLIEYVDVYGYRIWPVIDVRLVEPKRKDVWIVHYEGACPFTVENFRNEIMAQPDLGSGEYRFLLKERGMTGHVIQAYIHAMDLDRYMPEVDLRTLVNVHANREYVRRLRI